MITRPAFWTIVAHAFRRAALPLAAYYAVTLAVPLANGASPSGSFVRHALVVLAVPLILIVLVSAAQTIVQSTVNRARTWSARQCGLMSQRSHCREVAAHVFVGSWTRCHRWREYRSYKG